MSAHCPSYISWRIRMPLGEANMSLRDCRTIHSEALPKSKASNEATIQHPKMKQKCLDPHLLFWLFGSTAFLPQYWSPTDTEQPRQQIAAPKGIRLFLASKTSRACTEAAPAFKLSISISKHGICYQFSCEDKMGYVILFHAISVLGEIRRRKANIHQYNPCIHHYPSHGAACHK